MYNISKRSGVRFVPISVLIVVAAVSSSFLVVSFHTNVYAKYSNSQAQSLTNECEHNCVNSAPQNQGDGSVLAPTISVSDGQNEQGPGGIGEQGGAGQELQAREVPSSLVQIEPQNIGSARASCGAGEVITGGGFYIQDSRNPNPTVFNARDPENPNSTWLVQLINHDTTEAVIIQAFAECTMLADAS